MVFLCKVTFKEQIKAAVFFDRLVYKMFPYKRINIFKRYSHYKVIENLDNYFIYEKVLVGNDL